MKNHLLFVALVAGLFSDMPGAAAQDCGNIQDDKARLNCYDSATKKRPSAPSSKSVSSKPKETPLSPAGKSCVFSALQKLSRLPSLQVIASRATIKTERGANPIPGADYMDVEIDASAAGQKSTFMFLCVTGGPQNVTVTQALGQR